MSNLVYNVDFELVALFFSIILCVETVVCYPKQTRKNKIFRVLALMVIITQSFDILSAVSISYGSQISHWLNTIINTMYFMSGMFLCYMFHYYVQNAIVPPEGKVVLMKTNKVILAVMEVSVVFNMFFGYFFYISESGEYVHGVIYLLLHAVSFWFVICASVTLTLNARLLKRTQVVSAFSFVALYLVAVVVQTFVMPDVLIIMAAVSAILIIAIFSLESPDYIQLQKTLQELTETKTQLEEANKKYYVLAYTDAMTGLENRTAYNMRLEKLENSPDKKNVVFLMADINNLKLLNDRHGHLIGDRAIVKAANLLKRHFPDGSCYRIGGDEFAVVDDVSSEVLFIENYRAFKDDVEKHGKTSSYPFSVATGYQMSGDMTYKEARKIADEKMYEDKERLKNQVM